MKYLPHVALPLTMFGLLAMAFVLPKMVQKSSPESLKSPKSTFVSFTDKKEEAPVRNASVNTPASIAMPTQAAAVAASQTIEEPINETLAINEPVSNAVVEGGTEEVSGLKKSETDYDSLIKPFLAHIESGDLDKAEEALTDIRDEVPVTVKTGLQFSLDSARESQAQAKAAIAVDTALANSDVATVRSENQAAIEKARQDAEAMSKEIESLRAGVLTASADLPFPAAVEQAKNAVIVEPAATTAAIVKPDSQSQMELPEESSLLFGFNSSTVPVNAAQIIESAAATLKSNSRFGIQLRGYSDSVGSAQYNAILSRARSQSVKDMLVAKGVTPAQIELVPFGSSYSPRGRSINHRRVDLVFYER